MLTPSQARLHGLSHVDEDIRLILLTMGSCVILASVGKCGSTTGAE
jgi:hypothetical protein